MFLGKKQDPVDEFFTLLITATAESFHRAVDKTRAAELAYSLIHDNGDECKQALGIYSLIPIAYNEIRNWRGCGAGTCHAFYLQMRLFGWESLVPVQMLLDRPASLSQAHFRMWEGTLKREGIVPSAIQREYMDAERYLSHMVLHATTDLVYTHTGSYRPAQFGPVTSAIKTQLQTVVRKAEALNISDNFVAKELDGLKRAITQSI